jgi:hypothetical protein
MHVIFLTVRLSRIIDCTNGRDGVFFIGTTLNLSDLKSAAIERSTKSFLIAEKTDARADSLREAPARLVSNKPV